MHPTPVRRLLPVRLAVVVLGVLLLATGLAGPAQAERYIHRDPSRDVRRIGLFTTDSDGFVRAPNRRQADFVKVKMWHQVRTVRVVGKFRRLAPVGGGVLQIVTIRTPDGTERSFSLFAGPGAWKGADDDQPGTSCVVGHHVSFERDRLSMRISRSCLGRPRWVRVGVGVISMGRDSLFADDAQLHKVRDQLRFSPRLVHGDPR
jgi:hypothetical protein